MYEINSFIQNLSPMQKFCAVITILGIISSTITIALMVDEGRKEDRWRALSGILILLMCLIAIIYMDKIISP